MFKHVQTCLNLFRFNVIQIVAIFGILKHVWTCWNMSKLVQIQYDMNCYNSYNSQTCLNMFKTWLKLFRFNMIWIVTTHAILKHVWTYWDMSKLVQNHYDTNWYNSYTCQDTKWKHDEILWNLSKRRKECFWQQSDSLDRFEQVERSIMQFDWFLSVLEQKRLKFTT